MCDGRRAVVIRLIFSYSACDHQRDDSVARS